nr:hypothetical protein [Mycolicibacterium sp. CH28]
MDRPPRVRALKRVLATIADGIGPLVDLWRPYVDGLSNLPSDGRFLLVGNHTQIGTAESLLIPYAVRREIGVRSLTARDSAWGRFSQAVSKRFGGRDDMAMPLLRGVGPTLIPRPERMYLRFGAPIDTTTPVGIEAPARAGDVKRRTQVALEQILGDLLVLRETDPYRGLNPLGWFRAARPEPA